MGLSNEVVQDGSLLNEDIKIRHTVFRELHIVSHLSLNAHICDKTVSGLRVDAGKVASIRVPIGIAVLDIKQ